MKQGQAEAVTLPKAVTAAPLAIELRHLRYFVALADAGSFTHAAEQMFIAQPTLSQQIRRLEEIVGTRLLQRRREGLQLTKAGAVLLDASRTVLSLVDHEVHRTRQAAGLGRPRLRVAVPPRLPDALVTEAASALRSSAAAADVDLVWMEAPLDAEFSLIRQHRADAGLGWLMTSPEALPSPLDAMSLGEFEPHAWIPARHTAAGRGTISLDELTRMDVIHGPRRAEPGTYDAWTRVVRTVDPRFEFTDPPLRHSLPVDLALAATADRPTAVLTGPSAIAGSHPGLIRCPRRPPWCGTATCPARSSKSSSTPRTASPRRTRPGRQAATRGPGNQQASSSDARTGGRPEAPRPASLLLPGAVADQPLVQLGGEPVDLAGQVGVGLELQFLRVVVVIRLGLLDPRLPVLADHDERGQEDRLQRHDQRQHRPRLGLDEQHPDREQHNMQVDEVHPPRETGDPVSDPQLNVRGPLRLFLQDHRVLREFDRQRNPPVTPGWGLRVSSTRVWLGHPAPPSAPAAGYQACATAQASQAPAMRRQPPGLTPPHSGGPEKAM